MSALCRQFFYCCSHMSALSHQVLILLQSLVCSKPPNFFTVAVACLLSATNFLYCCKSLSAVSHQIFLLLQCHVWSQPPKVFTVAASCMLSATKSFLLLQSHICLQIPNLYYCCSRTSAVKH